MANVPIEDEYTDMPHKDVLYAVRSMRRRFEEEQKRALRCEDALHVIIDLALEHCDEDADEADLSPEDASAHRNGLIVQIARRALGKETT